jgi:uncharacterized protein (TIGR02246 family)
MPKDGLSGKNLDHISLSGTNMANADLSGSSLRRSQLRGTNLRGANLQGSDLHDAHLEQADVTGADLRGADLTGASLYGVNLDQSASIEGARFDDAQGLPDSQPLPKESESGAVRWDPGMLRRTMPDIQVTRDGEIEAIAGQILGRLEVAWNAADGQAFAAPFAVDADFVAIRGDHHHGRDAIAHGHQAIFDTVSQGSRQTYALLQARPLSSDVVLVLAQGTLNAPSGPMAGETRAISTLVLVRQETDWQVASFHNTLVAPSR